ELEVRRLDTGSVLSGLDGPEPTERGLDLARPDLVEHPLDEVVLDPDGLARQLGEALDRANDRGPGRLPVEPVEPERVREETSDASREPVELRERVLTQRNEDVDSIRRCEQCRQRFRERVWTLVVGVVEKVLLRLVEDEVHVAFGLGSFEGGDRRTVESDAGHLRNRLRERRGRVL